MGKKRKSVTKKKSRKKQKKKSWKLRLFLYLFLFTGLSVGVLAFLYYFFVVWFPGDQIKRENIMRILSRHSEVYYSDGYHQVGSFFGNSYRIYVPLKRIPRYCKEAVIAAEDRWFYKHPGFNPIAMFRAFIVDLKAGRIVQGGSTITQQTAKNLFGRRGRTITEKIRELINALRLERYYTKDEILEFYLNQFYVKGQGRGIGVAARYFFDKDVGKLSLKECAFIAGSVKGPSRYDIFRARTPQDEERIEKRITDRVNYVLRRMYEDGFITKDQYEKALREKLHFKMGIFQQKPNVMMDVVSSVLESPEFEKIWEETGIENIYTAGLKIYTTLDYRIERRALFSLRKRLSLLDTVLKGYRRPAEKRIPAYPALVTGFFLGTVVSRYNHGFVARIRVPAPRRVRVDLLKCPSIPVADYYHRSGRWVSPSSASARFLKKIGVGDTVLLSYDGRRFCIEKEPLLQGAVFVTQAGRIKAMVGGFSNLYYNRAWVARRQPGSIFKIPLYLSYFLLGQLNTDPLPDEREMYIYQGQGYFPRPDHTPHSKIVSVAWAGAYSENLATINLLFNLFNQSPPEDIVSVAKWVGLLPESGRLDKKFVAFLGKKGITISRRLLKCSLVEEVAKEKIQNEGFELSPEEVFALRNLRCNPAIASIRRKLIRKRKKSAEDLRKLRMTLYDYDFLIKSRDEIINKLERGDTSGLKIVSRGDQYLICTTPYSPCEGETIDFIPPAAESYFWVEGIIPVELLDEIQEKSENRYNQLLSNHSLYSPDVLVHLKDYRVLLALEMYIKLLRMAGVFSPLSPVPSLPLGSSSVTLPELSLVYTMISQGFTYRVDDQPYNLALIDRIEYDGEVIYKSQVNIEQKIPSRYVTFVDSVLEKVFQVGTAKSMRDRMVVNYGDKKIYLPVMGKTGTTNRFTNSSFVGILPVISRDGVSLSPQGGFVVAAYVGYDDNEPMRRYGYRVFGSNGALPVVADVMKEIIDFSDFQDILSFDSIEGNYVPLEMPDDFSWYEVDEVTGIPLAPVDDIESVDVTKRIETNMRRMKVWLPER